MKTRLCLLVPSMSSGGMERVMSELAWFFSLRNELEVHLVIYGLNRHVFYSLPENILIHKPGFEFNRSRRLLSTFRTMLFLRICINRIKPHSVLSFGELWNSFVLIALLGCKYPVYVSDRCQPDKSLGKFHDRLRRLLYRRAAGIVAQTYRAKEAYKQLNRNIKVIGNPIRFVGCSLDSNRKNVVLSVGRLIVTKNHDSLIKLFVRVGVPGWKLVIVGSDALKQRNKEKLLQLIAELHAQDRVFIVDAQSDISKYYLESKIFAFASSSEGFPNVIGEAQSAGLPVVAFDCVAGPSEMISDSVNGYLIPLFDYELFGKRLETLMKDEYLRIKLGNEARSTISNFSVGVIGAKYYEFIFAGIGFTD